MKVSELSFQMPGLTGLGKPNAQKVRFQSRDEALRALAQIFLRALHSQKMLDHIKFQVLLYVRLIEVIERDKANPSRAQITEETFFQAFPDNYSLPLAQLEDAVHTTRAAFSDYLGEEGADLNRGEFLKFMNKLLSEQRETHYDAVFKEMGAGLSLTEAIAKVNPEFTEMHGDDRQEAVQKYFKGVEYSAKKYGKPLPPSPRRKKRRG